MPLIVETQVSASGLPSPVPFAALSVGNQIAYNAGRNQVLMLNNLGDASVTAVVNSTPVAGSFLPGGIGRAIDLSTGFSVSLPVGVTAISLKDISRYLSGTSITVTSAAPDAELTAAIVS